MKVRITKGLYQGPSGRIYHAGQIANVALRTGLRMVREGLAERASKPKEKPDDADPESGPGTESAAA